jgi:hypothetical protein
MECRVKTAMFDLEEVVGFRPYHLPDAVPMLWPPLQGPQNEEIESALQYIEFFRRGHVADILPPTWQNVYYQKQKVYPARWRRLSRFFPLF